MSHAHRPTRDSTTTFDDDALKHDELSGVVTIFRARQISHVVHCATANVSEYSGDALTVHHQQQGVKVNFCAFQILVL